MILDTDPAAIAVLPAAYHELYAAVITAVVDDERVRAVWLSGSLARGDADAGSDLDLILAIADDDFEDFVAGWRDWLTGITPVLIGNEIPGSNLVFSSLTDRLCRLDGVVEPVIRVSESPHRARVVVLDRDGLDARVPERASGRDPDPARITAIITEFWRIQAIFPAMVDGRGDLLSALLGVQTARQLLYDVFVESNQPLPVTGVKKVSAKLTPDQLAALSGLPACSPVRAELIVADAAVCEAMAADGRAAADRVGAEYPVRIADVVTAHLAAMR